MLQHRPERAALLKVQFYDVFGGQLLQNGVKATAPVLTTVGDGSGAEFLPGKREYQAAAETKLPRGFKGKNIRAAGARTHHHFGAGS